MSVIRQTHLVYTVQPGDTLYSIAVRFGSTVEAIQHINALYPPITDPGLIYPGWTLIVPTPAIKPYRTIYIVKQGDTLYRIAQQFNTHPELLAGVNTGIVNPDLIQVGEPLWVPAMVYEVEQGDSLWHIAHKFQVSMNQLLLANEGRPGFSLDLIYPGFRLLIPLPSSRNIVVIRPYPGDLIESGIQVEGFARLFEANVLFQIRDDLGTVVSRERYTTALAGAPLYGYFSASLPFDQVPTTRGGEIWVYARSAKDGSIVDLVQVPVHFTS